MTCRLEDSQEQLVVSVNHLADLFVLAPVPYCILDRHGKILAGNFELARFVGCLRSEIVGKSLPSLVQLHDERQLYEHLDRCFTNLSQVSGELDASTWQGRVVVKVTSAPLVQADGEITSCMTTLTDVTALRAAAERLRLLSAAGEALAGTLDWESTLSTAVRLPVPSLGDTAFVDVCEDDGHVVRCASEGATVLDDLEDTPQGRVLATGQPFVCARCPEATIARAAGSAARRGGGGGSLLIVPLAARDRVLGVLTCIFTSERHHSSEDLALAEQLAARIAVAVDNARRHRAARRRRSGQRHLVDVVARDLRDALRGIRVACERLSTTPPWPDAGATRQLEAIDCGVLSMDQLTRDLLELSPPDSGYSPIAPVDCDATQLVLEALDLLRPLADEKGISLVASGARGQPVRCDRDLLVQALLNVVGNAIERTLACGSVWIDVASDEEQVIFAVRDTGDGLSPDELPDAFAAGVRRTVSDGVGFGLATAREIVEAHAGAIAIESAARAGTTVRITLPRRRPAALAPAP